MVDGAKALQSAMILGYGLQEYKYIMNHYSDTNISEKEKFEKCFNYYILLGGIGNGVPFIIVSLKR